MGDEVSGELFRFESDFVESLRCIPMAVRFKLDKTQVKLKLNEWSKLGQAERRVLLDSPCATPAQEAAWQAEVSDRVAKVCGAPPALLPDPVDPQWEAAEVPAQVREKAESEGIALSDAVWRALAPLRRFALVKLSRPGHENRNFVPAALEFGLRRA